MASFNLSSPPSFVSFTKTNAKTSLHEPSTLKNQFSITKCELNGSSSSRADSIKLDAGNAPKLEIGSPVIMVEAPQLLKTATAIPCLRLNEDLVKPGDVGRILSRKPKDVWVVRLSIGTFLIDGKYFKPLDFDA